MSAADINKRLGRRNLSTLDMAAMTSGAGVLSRGFTVASDIKLFLPSNTNKLHYSLSFNIHFPSTSVSNTADIAIYIGEQAEPRDEYLVTEVKFQSKPSTYNVTHKVSASENIWVWSNVSGLVVRLEGYEDGLY